MIQEEKDRKGITTEDEEEMIEQCKWSVMYVE
jgi:hypothetical protein